MLKHFLAYLRADISRMLSVALVYALLTKWMLEFIFANGIVSIVWSRHTSTPLIPSYSNWDLQIATAINDAGRIVGVGINS